MLKHSWQEKRVFIFEALDEIASATPRDSQLLQLFMLFSEALQDPNVPPIHIVITSRPRPEIRLVMEWQEIADHVQTICMEDFDTQEDIARYLQDSFNSIYYRHNLSAIRTLPWPPDATMKTLLERSHRFIVAATLVRYTDHEAAEVRLSSSSNILQTNTVNPVQDVFDLYQAVVDYSAEDVAKCFQFLSDLVTLAQPLPVRDLSALLGIGRHGVQAILDSVSAIVSVPSKPTEPVIVFHPSLRDFLAGSPHPSANLDNSHRRLFCGCMHLMARELTTDICGLGDAFKLHAEVIDFARKVETRLSWALRYACRHWIFHLQYVQPDAEVTFLVHEFLHNRLLHWVEVLSLVGQLNDVVLYAIKARTVISSWESFDHKSEAMTLLYELQKLILEFFDCISVSALHVYHSALPFVPTTTRLRAVYGLALQAANVEVEEGLDTEWDFCHRTIECLRAKAVSVSPDGEWAAVASEQGVLIWDMTTGLLITTVSQTPVCKTLAFSPDGRFLAFGTFSPRRWQLWNMFKDTTSIPLDNPSDAVPCCCAFYHRGDRVACAFEQPSEALSKVYIWDMTTRTSLFIVHLDAIRHMRFSRSDEKLLSATDDTVYVWQNTTGAQLQRIDRNQGSFPRDSWHFFTPDDHHIVHIITGHSRTSSYPHALPTLGVLVSPSIRATSLVPAQVNISVRVAMRSGICIAARIEDKLFTASRHDVDLSLVKDRSPIMYATKNSGKNFEGHDLASGVSFLDLSQACFGVVKRKRPVATPPEIATIVLPTWTASNSFVLGEHITTTVEKRTMTLPRIRFISADADSGHRIVHTHQVDPDHREIIVFAPRMQAIAYRCSAAGPIKLLCLGREKLVQHDVWRIGDAIFAWKFSNRATFLAAVFWLKYSDLPRLRQFHLCVWEVATGALVGEMTLVDVDRSSIAFSPNDAHLAVVCKSQKELAVFYIRKKGKGFARIFTSNAPPQSSFFAPYFSENNTIRHVLVCYQDFGTVSVAIQHQNIYASSNNGLYTLPQTIILDERKPNTRNNAIEVLASTQLSRVLVHGSAFSVVLDRPLEFVEGSSPTEEGTHSISNRITIGESEFDTLTWSDVRLTRDGWIFVGEKRVCWVPVRYRLKQSQGYTQANDRPKAPTVGQMKNPQSFRGFGNGIVLMEGNRHLVMRFRGLEVRYFD
ncbi:TolB C-terminal domain-containing protein [Coniophora puteana RWD-64-598 SS2]|uniref:TolB C-terminal domain-containing protein n=1 Tax=Coniophora puteana (strain RWD-64-598) TaxID=741705 RepID=A0A5M3MI03_CONPW|nr:TolB C-terminal domain-containing protein [Coniophora puteana RWD-64-598 SS2]EIW78261.1 TolB C-terminal domain-containing protein [Coniophora puteana RWD-64-598 SS2]